MEAENAATIEDRDKTIRTFYYGKDGGSTAYKTHLDAKAIDPRVTLDWVRGWFKEKCRKKNAGRRSNKFLRGTPCFPRILTGFVFHHR